MALNMKEERKKIGLTQIEFAKRLGFSNNTVSKMERGDLPVRKVTELAIKYIVMDETKQLPLAV